MKPLYTVVLVVCMVLQTSTAQADFRPTEVAINGETIIEINGETICLSCSLTEVPQRDCTYPSPLCRVYLLSHVPPSISPIEEIAFTVRDDDNLANHWFSFWDVGRGQWFPVPITTGDPGINITKSGNDWRVENTEPYPYYFSSGAGTPIFRASRFNLRWIEGFWSGDYYIFPRLEVYDRGVIEIWAPTMD